MSNNSAFRSGAAAMSPKLHKSAQKRGWALPAFFYFLIVYIGIKYYVPDVRVILFSSGNYIITYVEAMYLLATFIAMGELLRVSKPGINNTVEALMMMLVWVVYLVCFILGATKIPYFHFFNNTEFLVIGLIVAAQVVLAFIINGRTLQRTINYSDDSGA